MNIIPFIPAHLDQIILQPSQVGMRKYFTAQYAKDLSQHISFTAVDVSEKILGCAGLIEEDPRRAYAWVLLSPDLGRKLIPFHKKIEAMLALSPYDRIETVVDSTFSQGLRWMELLGFTYEGHLNHFFGIGEHAKLYAYFPHSTPIT
jgi:hypothetical protein